MSVEVSQKLRYTRKALMKAMSRSKIQQIKTYIHMSNNDALEPQKRAEVLPSYEVLNVKKKNFGTLHQILSAYGSMVSNSRRHPCQ